MIKFSLYDFDRTIYSKDTGVEILKQIAKKNIKFWLYLPYILLGVVLYSIKIISKDKLKEIIFSPLSLFTKSQWEVFIKEFWIKESKNYFDNVILQMQKDRQNGYIVGIISASAEIFLMPLSDKADFIIGTVLDLSQKKISSKLIGKNCKNQEKVARFLQFLEEFYPNQEYIVSKMYSDSLHDMPLFEIAENPFTVESDGTIREGLPKPNKNL